MLMLACSINSHAHIIALLHLCSLQVTCGQTKRRSDRKYKDKVELLSDWCRVKDQQREVDIEFK